MSQRLFSFVILFHFEMFCDFLLSKKEYQHRFLKQLTETNKHLVFRPQRKTNSNIQSTTVAFTFNIATKRNIDFQCLVFRYFQESIYAMHKFCYYLGSFRAPFSIICFCNVRSVFWYCLASQCFFNVCSTLFPHRNLHDFFMIFGPVLAKCSTLLRPFGHYFWLSECA